MNKLRRSSGPVPLMVVLMMLVFAVTVLAQETTTSSAPETATSSGQETMSSSTQETTTYSSDPPEVTTTYSTDPDPASEAAGAAACAVCAGVGLIFPLLGLALSIGLAVWIYRDAQRRGNPQAAMWAVIGFVFNIVGLVIYLVARPKTPGIPPSPPAPMV